MRNDTKSDLYTEMHTLHIQKRGGENKGKEEIEREEIK